MQKIKPFRINVFDWLWNKVFKISQIVLLVTFSEPLKIIVSNICYISQSLKVDKSFYTIRVLGTLFNSTFMKVGDQNFFDIIMNRCL